ncbi:glucan endo-1,3-beta-glucosidase 6-like [Musa acuminata AAA Group]|uniref:glucan endo-1,3-beta-glucosidase 6-like n=1 Tax=Musa acuminata AAA Group TaxID=214697 RepID=UPI0031DBC66D
MGNMGWFSVGFRMICGLCFVVCVGGIGANWGTQTSHPIPPNTVVQMLKNNGFQKVKLFDADEGLLNALKKSGLEVMVGIPNDMLAVLAANTKAAQNWVSKNVSEYINDGVNIRYVAVGNEPFLQTYNGSFLQTTFPALRNVQGALTRAGLSSQVKVTIPLNADVYESSSGRPSDGDFRSDIRDLMLAIVKFLSDNAAPFTVNIYPFISLYSDPNFPVDYAFFEGNSSPVIDGTTSYTNMFDANHDTLIWALKKNGYGNLPVIVGEIGWPTDGDMNANPQYAQRFNQGFMNHILMGQGTPVRPGPIDAYLFSLIDEDEKSIQPGNFERHWGIFTYDGLPKYQLNLGTTKAGGLVRALNVQYLDKKWCVLKPSVNLDDSRIAPSVSYACANADCTSLGYNTSCGNLDAQGNISYALNSFYQKNDQDAVACDFSNLATITEKDPTTGTCRFEIMIVADSGMSWNLPRSPICSHTPCFMEINEYLLRCKRLNKMVTMRISFKIE